MTSVKRLTVLRLLWALMVSIASGGAFARGNEADDFSEQDFAIYPQFCRARLEREPKELVDYWTRQLGPRNFLHMHHYCFGLKALNLAYASLGKKKRRERMASMVIANFNYILEHTERNFYMRPEALVNLARGYQLKKEYDSARRNYDEAIRLNPKMVEAWVALSDMFYEIGKKSDALYVLETAREKVGENKKIDLRIADIRAAGIKASAPKKDEE